MNPKWVMNAPCLFTIDKQQELFLLRALLSFLPGEILKE